MSVPKSMRDSPVGVVGAGARSRIWQGGLQRRFLSIVVAGAALFAILAGAVTFRIGHDRAYESGREEVNALLSAVGRTAAIGAYASDRVLIQEVVRGIASNPLVERAEVRDGAGRVLGDAGGIERSGDSEVEVRYPLASPFEASETVGWLSARIEVGRLEASARRSATLFTLLMVGQTALVSLLIYLVAAHLVSRPIAWLAGTLRVMQPGTTERLPTPSRHAHDEIGTLIDGANDLLAANDQALRRERELRAEIERMEAQYRQIFDSSSAGIFVLDSQGRLINGNPTVTRMIGMTIDEIRRLPGERLMKSIFARPERVRAMITDATARRETVSADLEVLRTDGVRRWVHCLISVQGVPLEQRLVEGVMYDVTDRKQQEAEVRHRAEHDALTGLMNRSRFDSALGDLLAIDSMRRDELSLLFLDLDGFKKINDAHGHKAGDRVLSECAARLRAATRRDLDLVARVGGDEFVAALKGIGPGHPDLARIAARLVESLQEPIVLEDGQTVCVGTSVGISCYPRHGTSQRQLLHAADAVMYEVKRSGKNSFAMAMTEPEPT